MDAAAETSPLRTFHHTEFGAEALLEAKARTGLTTAVVLPARNEEASVASVVAAFDPLRQRGVLDELVVVDSLSDDRTAAVAEAAGATVVAVGDEVPSIPPVPGKGEAMWRGLHGTTADLVAFCDADVLDAGAHYALGLLGPLLLHPEIQLVKGYYHRPIVALDGTVEEHGGRVTELAARPFLNLYRPELGHFIQPLAGEWAGRRAHLESLAFPVGYGVEIAVLLDSHAACGLAGLAQCDLGTRTHRRQSQQALGVMAAQVLAAAIRRLGVEPAGALVRQFGVGDHREIDTGLVLDERPPVASVRSPSRPA